MKFGLLLSCPTSVDTKDRFELLQAMAIQVDHAGFDLLAAGQHFGDSDQQLLQPIPLLAAIAPSVSLKLMTGVLIAPLLHPVAAAEDITSLQLICSGRAIVGVGAGHRPGDFEALGVSLEERGRRLEDCVLRIRNLLSGKDDVKIALSSPPPIWVAASSDAGVRRAARIGDAWYVGPGTPVGTVVRQLGLYGEELSVLNRAEPAAQAIRRDVFVTGESLSNESLADAISQRYRSQQRWGYTGDLPPDVRSQREKIVGRETLVNSVVGEEVIAGSIEECIEQFLHLEASVGRPVLAVLKVGWRLKTPSQVLDSIGVLTEICSHLRGEG